LLILTKTESSTPERIQQQVRYLHKYTRKIIISKTTAGCLKNYQNSLELSTLQGKRIALFCGLGLPKNFFSFFSKQQVLFTKEFTDHHKYSIEELNLLVSKSKSGQADYLITTEKDFYNFPQGWKIPDNLLYLSIATGLLTENGQPLELTTTILNSKM